LVLAKVEEVGSRSGRDRRGQRDVHNGHHCGSGDCRHVLVVGVIKGAVVVLAEPRVLEDMRGGKIIGPEEPKMSEWLFGFEEEVLFESIRGEWMRGGSGNDLGHVEPVPN
jgi:hypothetical protein